MSREDVLGTETRDYLFLFLFSFWLTFAYINIGRPAMPSAHSWVSRLSGAGRGGPF